MQEPISKEQRSHLRVETSQVELFTFWQKRMGEDLPVLNLPVRRQSSSYEGRAVLVRRRLLPPEVFEKAEQWSRRWDIDLFAMMVSVFQVLLSRYSGQEDILVEAVDARTAGHSACTYLIRSNLSDNPTWTELVRRLSEWLSDVRDRPLPIELLEQIVPPGDSGNVNVRFAWGSTDGDAGVQDCNLLLALETGRDGVQCVLSYNPSLFADEMADSMHRHFASLLQSAVEHPECPVHSRADDRSMSYWRERLQGAATVLDLPTDRPRPPKPSGQVAVCGFALSPQLTAGLQAVGRQEQATLYMSLLAVFHALLHRYSGQEDILVGSPVAGRSSVESEELIGYFVNTLVMRADLSGKPSFRELLRRVREDAVGAFAHADLPFEKLVEELQPERDLSRNPLFQVMFSLQNASMPKGQQDGLHVEPREVANGTAKFDLTLYLEEAEEGLSGWMEYSTDLWDEATIVRLVSHFERLLAAAVSEPDRPLAELPLLSEAERHQLLAAWNDTEREYPLDVCLHRWIEQQAQRTPDATAVVFEEVALSYGELNAQANYVAELLQQRGVRPDVLVGISMERSLEMVVGLLGILKAGGAYVPLDPTYPEDRLAYMLEDSQVPVLLTQRRIADRLPAHRADVIFLDEVHGETAANPTSAVKPDHLAYVIYTSGSTGKPKGVMVPHRGIVNRLLWMQDEYQLTEADRVLQKTPFSFDVSVWEFFWPLMTGARLVVAKPGGHQDSRYLAELMEEQGITTCHFVPPMLQVFLQEPDLNGCRSLRQVMCSGEALPYELQERFFERLDAELHNLYGPTEASVDVTYWACERSSARKIVPIGRPVANTQMYVLDEKLQPVPIGVPGELHIGGVQVARGYLNRPELSEEKFIPNPFDPLAEGRLYKTGDLARFLPDGSIEYIGRIDHQVKIRGFRIELGEIEAVLAEHPAVREVVVSVREEDAGDKRLVSYMVLDPGASRPALGEVRQFLGERLPEHMIPSAFVVMERMPLTPNGKVDRRALPAHNRSQLLDSSSYAAPRNVTERALVELWADVLKLPAERIGIHDRFFDLGGHSLLGTQLLSRIRNRLQADLSIVDLFERPTVAQMGEKIASDGTVEPKMERVSRNQELILSFNQQRLWFLEELTPGTSLYNLPLIVRFKGQLHTDALDASLQEILRRHEALRTTFERRGQQTVQVIHPPQAVPLPLTDLKHLREPEREDRAHQLILDEVQKPFDLQRGPLLRALLLGMGEEEHVLVLTMHHIVSDGWSKWIFAQELAEFYEAHVLQRPSAWADPVLQYADYAHWQRSRMTESYLEKHLKYWKKQLGDSLPVLELPIDFPRPPVQTYRGRLKMFQVAQGLSERLKQLSQQQGVTLFMTLVAAYNVFLHRYSRQDDILIGTPIANRNQLEVENLIGFFVNTVVLRLSMQGDPSFVELLSRVRDVSLDAFCHQDLPFEKLVEELNPERDVSRTPVFQAWFVFQNTPAARWDLPGLTASTTEIDSGITQFDLNLDMAETDEGLRGIFNYNVDLFRAQTIDSYCEQFVTLLELVAEQPHLPLSQLVALMEQAERDHLMRKQQDLKQSVRSKFKKAKADRSAADAL